MSEPLRIMLNIAPYRLDVVQQKRLTDFSGAGSAIVQMLSPADDLQRFDGAETDVLVTEDVPRDLRRWPKLKWIQLVSAGIDHLDDHPIWRSKIAVTTASGIHAVPIAQYALCTLLMLIHKMPEVTRFKETTRWPDRGRLGSTQLRGLTAGLIGYGSIGRECARQFRAMGMKVVCLKKDPNRRRQDGFVPVAGIGDLAGEIPERWFAPDQLHEMLPMCDVLVVTAPRTAQTLGMIGARELALLPKGARVIVVSRGGIVEEAALSAALSDGQVSGAAVDCFLTEPPAADNPLFMAPNVILTPHISGVFDEYWPILFELLIQNLSRYARGKALVNQVNDVDGKDR
jgi:phosphoglycerate dehydrogenase-like enzyme